MALHRCYPQADFAVFKVVFSKWSVICSTLTHVHTY